ncbi:MAG TPA: oxidoreductase, partial [Bacteroidetes bacterium]|nr:oxidoreductase [Bacteroidota bacterium]
MSQKLRWGVLGAAKIARNRVIPAIIQSSNGVLSAIASRSQEKADEIAEEF